MARITSDPEEQERILKLHLEATKRHYLKEQAPDFEEKKAIQCFLNKVVKAGLKVDGMHGKATEDAITKYQSMRKVYPADGVWGPETQKAMTKSDSDRLTVEECAREHGTIIDKILKFIGIG